jgi:2-amino-4-hydroxy-6-hydroxymethyldihydropteridine diphosphokinase
LGDRAGALAEARLELSACVSISNISSIYETPPWGVTDQPAFLNQVLTGTTELEPDGLLNAVKAIEKKMGRQPTFRYGPRLIDIDILLYGDIVLDTPDLVIPHPRMFERAFVLVPLLEIAPDLVSPITHEPVSDLLQHLDTAGIVKWEADHA